MSSVIAEYEVELSSLNLSESQKEVVMRLLSTFEKGGAKAGEDFGSTFVKGGKGGGKGRPSKSKKVVETGGESDVFEQLLSMGLEDPPLGKVSAAQAAGSRWQEPNEERKALAPPLSKVDKETEILAAKAEKLAAANAKSAEKAAKAAEKQAAKDAKEAAKQAVIDAKLAKEVEKASKAAEKQAAKDAKEAAKQAVIDAKLAKEAEKAAAIKAKEDAKLAKEAEKEAKAAAKLAKEAVKAEKAAAKAEKEASKVEKIAVELEPAPAAETKTAANAEQEGSKGNLGSPAVRVKKFSFEGVKYLKDTAGTIYDLATQDRIGVWNEDEKKIVLDAKGEEDEEDECSEEEYHL